MNDAANPPSKLLVEESFAAGEDQFLDEFRKIRSHEFLVAFVDRWLADDRIWSRQQMAAYLNGTLNLPGHEVVFKRLVRHFEDSSDHEMLGHLMVALDRIVRRQRVREQKYSWRPRAAWTVERLVAKPNKTVIDRPPETQEHKTPLGGTYTIVRPGVANHRGNRLFTQRTRAYLRRRVWRYFRHLSYRAPSAYLRHVTDGLRKYRDEDLRVGENIIDNWSLMHVCFFGHAAISFGPAHTNLSPGHSLAELSPSPYQPNLWRSAAAAEYLVSLICTAESALVRIWAMELLKAEHHGAIGKMDAASLAAMLSHHDPRVQEFSRQLFERHAGLANLPLSSWLTLVDSAAPAALETVCNALERHVAPQRFSIDQVLRLVLASPVPVARLGFRFLQTKHAQSPLDGARLATLSQVRCAVLASESTRWSLQLLGCQSEPELDDIVQFFDSPHKVVRKEAFEWLSSHGVSWSAEPAFWTRLIETPYADVNVRLIDILQRQSVPVEDASDLKPLWSGVILGIHTGGRAKLLAIDQLKDAIAEDHRCAQKLLPVLLAAVRSVRAPERRRALAAIAALLENTPTLGPVVSKYLPELEYGVAATGHHS